MFASPRALYCAQYFIYPKNIIFSIYLAKLKDINKKINELTHSTISPKGNLNKEKEKEKNKSLKKDLKNEHIKEKEINSNGLYYKKNLFNNTDLNSSYFNDSILSQFEDLLKSPLNLGIYKDIEIYIKLIYFKICNYFLRDKFTK